MKHTHKQYLLSAIGLILFFMGIVPGISCKNPFMTNAGIEQPIVVITFDDADPSVYAYAFPTMRSIDSTWGATHFFPVTYVGENKSITLAQIHEMENAGWETGGHGYTHVNLSSISADSAEVQVKASYDFLVANGFKHDSYAYAWGNYNETVLAIVKKYFNAIRTAHDYDYLDGVNQYELGYFAVQQNHTATDVIARVEKAKSLGAPLVVIGFHAVRPDTTVAYPGTYWCKESVYYQFLVYLKKHEYTVTTLHKAVNLLCD
jgi:peptidoglycan/xylan/chitin deacetylase (PgdA/CDA1 family)